MPENSLCRIYFVCRDDVQNLFEDFFFFVNSNKINFLQTFYIGNFLCVCWRKVYNRIQFITKSPIQFSLKRRHVYENKENTCYVFDYIAVSYAEYLKHFFTFIL